MRGGGGRWKEKGEGRVLVEESALLFEPDVFVVVEGERGFLPALHGGLDESRAGAPIDGGDGGLFEEIGFGFLEGGVAAGGVEFAVGGGDEGVVGGVESSRCR